MKWIVLFLFTITSLWSAPAFSGKQQFEQPDGTTFTARLQGDEYLNWIETDEGDILRFNKKRKTFDYAIIKESKLMYSGERYEPSHKEHQTAPLHPRVTKDQLRDLWQLKRLEAVKRQKR